jgi:hypothetical protein
LPLKYLSFPFHGLQKINQIWDFWYLNTYTIWHPRADELESSATSDDEVLVLVGGFDGEHILDSVEVYSPTGGCNVPLAPLPESVYELFAVFFRGSLFACGGDAGKKCWRFGAELYHGKVA